MTEPSIQQRAIIGFSAGWVFSALVLYYGLGFSILPTIVLATGAGAFVITTMECSTDDTTTARTRIWVLSWPVLESEDDDQDVEIATAHATAPGNLPSPLTPTAPPLESST